MTVINRESSSSGAFIKHAEQQATTILYRNRLASYPGLRGFAVMVNRLRFWKPASRTYWRVLPGVAIPSNWPKTNFKCGLS